MADEKVFLLQIISPDEIFFEEEADFVEMTTTEGRIGVYKNHIPMTYVIVPGTVNIYLEGKIIEKVVVHSGFVEILPDSITILSEVCEWPEKIDVERAKKSKARAEKRLKENNPETNILRAEASLRRSLARLNATKNK